MANARVKRVMIDTGSSADILYLDAFQKLGLTDKDLVSLTSALTGFTGDSVSPLGATTIPVTFGEEPKSKTLMVVPPPDVVFPTLRIQMHDKEASSQQLHENLDLLEEKRADAHLRTLAYKKAIVRLYNHKVRPRFIKTGDLVLWKAEVSDPTRSRRKLAPNWEGPYRVVDVIGKETCTLETVDGRLLSRTRHISNLQKCYA
ncbi:hypothetical protein BHE74_00044596 [Ensete ventricosum]|nr:hypothetical protein BHE74_00044596 [Ensete ventricosum]